MKAVKRFLTGIVFSALISVNVFAAVELRIDDATVQREQTFTVNVTISDHPNIRGGRINIGYDSEVLSFMEGEIKTGDWMISQCKPTEPDGTNNQSGQIEILFAGSPGALPENTKTVFATLRFYVPANAVTGDSVLTYLPSYEGLLHDGENYIPLTAHNGTITVELIGDTPDLDGDGRVDINDLLLTCDFMDTGGPRGDINGDGRIDLFDLLEIISLMDGPTSDTTPEPADTDFEIAISDITVSPGDTDFEVDVTINDKGPEIRGAEIYIEYDPDILIFQDRTMYDSAIIFRADLCNGGQIRILLASDSEIPANTATTLASLTFDVSETAEEGLYPLSILASSPGLRDNEINPVPYKSKSGIVTVELGNAADIDKNGRVDINDVLLTCDFLDAEDSRSDINGDGSITITDIVWICNILDGPIFDTTLETTDTDFGIAVSDVIVSPGDTDFEVDITINDKGPGIRGAQIYIEYAPDILTFKEGELNGDPFYSHIAIKQPGLIEILSANFSAAEHIFSLNTWIRPWTATTLASLTFDISETAEEGLYPLSILASSPGLRDNEINPVPYRIKDGTVTVKNREEFKVIILAGGGPYPENNIWEATQMCAIQAYQTLTYQGYPKESIYYLSADPVSLDLDGDAIPKEVHEATKDNFRYAVTDWADSTEELLIYMVDHGGIGTFQMNPDEILRATELDEWLDIVQPSIPGKIILIYDACYSGIFLPLLAGEDRILVASTSPDHQAVFAEEGTVSFSSYLWTRIFSGDSFFESFRHARESVPLSYKKQDAQIDADGDGVPNQPADYDIARQSRIGKELTTAPALPTIGSVSPEKELEGETSALIYAENVSGLNEITRVWAVITPPQASDVSPDEPITELETLELNPVGNNRYEAAYNGFDSRGTYHIVIFAEDNKGSRSNPKATAVTQNALIQNSGFPVTDTLRIRAVIDTVEKGPVEAVWQKGGHDQTARGDKVIWGYFYADPDDVAWGSPDNPDLFVKIWFDVSGRVDVNFFHVSVPDIEVYSEFGGKGEHGMTTLSARYIRHYYESGQSGSEVKTEDGNPPAGYAPAGNPSGYDTVNSLRFGAVINTAEKGLIDAKWRPGGEATTAGGHQVVWGHFYADPSDVTWGSPENPDLFVKIWFDAGGRTDVNFFHVSVPDIEVFSDFPEDGAYDQKGTTVLENRYIRQVYQR